MSDMGTKGFTLIELLIVIAIVGILTTIAVLNFGGIIDSYKARGAASHLYSDMQLARLRAIKEGKKWAVEFTSATAYCVKSEVNSTGSVDGFSSGCTTTTDTILKDVDLATDYSGVVSSCTNTRVVFNPNGTAGGCGNSFTISKGARTQTITINTSTGNIRMQ